MLNLGVVLRSFNDKKLKIIRKIEAIIPDIDTEIFSNSIVISYFANFVILLAVCMLYFV